MDGDAYLERQSGTGYMYCCESDCDLWLGSVMFMERNLQAMHPPCTSSSIDGCSGIFLATSRPWFRRRYNSSVLVKPLATPRSSVVIIDNMLSPVVSNHLQLIDQIFDFLFTNSRYSVWINDMFGIHYHGQRHSTAFNSHVGLNIPSESSGRRSGRRCILGETIRRWIYVLL